ncbi:lysoplasmalogenase [Flavobacteriaceae bacterium]|nr:lysoplasmalogenase [Flavobacteriaceae bacterium]
MKKFAYLFWITGIIHVIGQYTGQELLSIYTKPLLIPFLAGFYYTKNYDRTFFWALFLSWMGDLFLMKEDFLFFLLGILSFWGAQIIYLKMINKELNTPLKKIFSTKKIILPLLLFGGYFTTTMILLGSKLGTLAIPISGYALTLSIIGITTTLLTIKNKDYKSLALLLGVVLFITSDSMIAFNTFYFEENIFGFLVMATYIPAQFFICNYFKKTH